MIPAPKRLRLLIAERRDFKRRRNEFFESNGYPKIVADRRGMAWLGLVVFTLCPLLFYLRIAHGRGDLSDREYRNAVIIVVPVGFVCLLIAAKWTFRPNPIYKDPGK